MAKQKERVEISLLGMAIRQDNVTLLRRTRATGQKYQLPIIRHVCAGEMTPKSAFGLDPDTEIREFGTIATEHENGTSVINKLYIIQLETCPHLLFRGEKEDMLLLKLSAGMFGRYSPIPLAAEARSAIDIYTFALGDGTDRLSSIKKVA